MKGGLCIIYTSLLTISVLSSFALFILVVTEVGQAYGHGDESVDLSGLHNVSQKSVVQNNNEASSVKGEENLSPGPEEDQKSVLKDQEMIFADALSLNSVTTEGLPDTGQPPILISLAENAKLDLKSPEDLLFVNDSEQHNDTKTFVVLESSDSQSGDREKNVGEQASKDAEPYLVVKAKPKHEMRQTDDAFQSTTTATLDAETTTESQIDVTQEEKKDNIPKPQTPQEDIPSFSEWAQKQLAEAEKQDTVLNHSSQPSHSNTNLSHKNTKLRSKNYASLACGAKVVAVNPEAGSPSAILSPNRDEYMLNTCNSRIWFVVELCEAVQAQKIELANFELFSSTPKEFIVYVSDRFTSREWTSVGQFTAKDFRDVQSFDLFPHLFGKFIKVELLSHHGSEHYCPISLFKVYGTSEFEVLEKENAQHAANIEEDEDDEIMDIPDVPVAETEASKNLFGSARDAVMSIMKKAAQALVKTEVPKNVSSEQNDTSVDKMYKKCCSPSHIIVCDNCSETLYTEVYELISCSSDKLYNLLRQAFIRDTLKCTRICKPFGLDFKSTKTIEFSDERVAYISAMFSQKYIAALCNMLAIQEKKVVLNTSFETESNTTTNVTLEESSQNTSSVTKPEQDMVVVESNVNETEDKKQTETTEEKPLEIVIVNESAITEDNSNADKEQTDVNKLESPNLVEDKPLPEPQPPLEDLMKSVNEGEKIMENKVEPDAKDGLAKTESKYNKPEVIEKGKESNGAEEFVDQTVMDSLISDLDQIAVDPTPPNAQNSHNQNPAQATLQKESVFLRLSNRVKTLERNMSLSGQYLEELSRRYKKQVEEMQKTFEKTVIQMTEERRKSNEREQKYLEQMTNMQEQILQMTVALKVLMEERDSWFGNMTVFKFIFFHTIIATVAFYYFTRRRKMVPIMAAIPKKLKKKEKLRRKSVEGVSGHATPSAKKRRPSEEALQIARQAAVDGGHNDEGEWQVAKKNRRRKTSIVHRNLEYEAKPTWGRRDSIGKLQENPIPLDEEEFYAPVPEPREFNRIATQTLPKELQKNGTFLNSLKTIKTRRLSSPAFLRTFSRQTTRSTPSPVVRTLEPIYNGNVTQKAASESPTGSLWSESTEISQNGRDYQINGNNNKKKKSLKNIFKKVF